MSEPASSSPGALIGAVTGCLLGMIPYALVVWVVVVDAQRGRSLLAEGVGFAMFAAPGLAVSGFALAFAPAGSSARVVAIVGLLIGAIALLGGLVMGVACATDIARDFT